MGMAASYSEKLFMVGMRYDFMLILSDHRRSYNMADKKQNQKVPPFKHMGQVNLADGHKAFIMTPYQWAKYNYDFNVLNDHKQP